MNKEWIKGRNRRGNTPCCLNLNKKCKNQCQQLVPCFFHVDEFARYTSDQLWLFSIYSVRAQLGPHGSLLWVYGHHRSMYRRGDSPGSKSHQLTISWFFNHWKLNNISFLSQIYQPKYDSGLLFIHVKSQQSADFASSLEYSIFVLGMNIASYICEPSWRHNHSFVSLWRELYFVLFSNWWTWYVSKMIGFLPWKHNVFLLLWVNLKKPKY